MATQGSPSPVFEVRRARWFTLFQLALALGLLAVTLANLNHQLAARDALTPAILFVALAVFYAWSAWRQFVDRTPQLVVSADGLWLVPAAPKPIPWPRIWHLAKGQQIIGGPRLEGQLDPAIVVGLKFGQRYMGDHIVRLRGQNNGFCVHIMGLDRSLDDIYAAIRRYWPPDTGPA